MSVIVSETISDRFIRVFSNTDNLLEGGFWGLLNGWYVYTLKKEISHKSQLDLEPSSPEKTQKIWTAKKEIFIKNCSLVSNTFFIGSWLVQKGLFVTRSLPFLHLVSYFMSTVVYSIRMVESVQSLNRGRISYYQTNDRDKRQDLSTEYFKTLLQVALYATTFCWGFLTVLNNPLIDIVSFHLVDRFFYYAVVLFISNMASAIVLPKKNVT